MDKDFEKLKDMLHFNKKVFILPHYGEFGWLILRIMRLMHIVNAPEKIICCKPGEEVFYPSADKYYYDWENNIVDKDKRSWSCRVEDQQEIIARIKEKYKYHIILNLSTPDVEGCVNFNSKTIDTGGSFAAGLQDSIIKNIHYELKPKINNIKTDVVLGARKRLRSIKKNWAHWNEIGELLKEKGLSYSVAGTKAQSYHVDGAKYYAWEQGNPSDSSVELIQNCRMYIGSDAGVTHLASFIRKPIITVGNRPIGSINRWMHCNNENNIIHTNSIHYDKNNINNMIDSTIEKEIGF